MQIKPQPGDIVGYVNGKPVPAVGGGAPDAPAPSAQPTMSNSADGSVIVGADPRTTPAPTFTVVQPGTNTITTSTNPAAVFSAEDIAKARQQEKEKLYPELQTMKEQLAELKKERDEKLEQERKAREAAEAQAEEARKADTDTRTLLEQQKAEFDARLEALQQERTQERQVLEMERAFQELNAYKATALAAAVDIIPELTDEVRATQHTSREEIDTHIARLQATSQRIIEQMQAARQQQRASMPGVPVTAPSSGPLDNYSANDPVWEAANNGSLSMSDYVKNRDKLLSGVSRNTGLLG